MDHQALNRSIDLDLRNRAKGHDLIKHETPSDAELGLASNQTNSQTSVVTLMLRRAGLAVKKPPVPAVKTTCNLPYLISPTVELDLERTTGFRGVSTQNHVNDSTLPDHSLIHQRGVVWDEFKSKVSPQEKCCSNMVLTQMLLARGISSVGHNRKDQQQEVHHFQKPSPAKSIFENGVVARWRRGQKQPKSTGSTSSKESKSLTTSFDSDVGSSHSRSNWVLDGMKHEPRRPTSYDHQSKFLSMPLNSCDDCGSHSNDTWVSKRNEFDDSDDADTSKHQLTPVANLMQLVRRGSDPLTDLFPSLITKTMAERAHSFDDTCLCQTSEEEVTVGSQHQSPTRQQRRRSLSAGSSKDKMVAQSHRAAQARMRGAAMGMDAILHDERRGPVCFDDESITGDECCAVRGHSSCGSWSSQLQLSGDQDILHFSCAEGRGFRSLDGGGAASRTVNRGARWNDDVPLTDGHDYDLLVPFPRDPRNTFRDL